jgi:hypothetical protein
MILDGSRVSTIDLSACVALREAVKVVQGRGHVIAMCGFPDNVRDIMRAFGIVALLQPPIVSMTVSSAVKSVRPVMHLASVRWTAGPMAAARLVGAIARRERVQRAAGTGRNALGARGDGARPGSYLSIARETIR